MLSYIHAVTLLPPKTPTRHTLHYCSTALPLAPISIRLHTTSLHPPPHNLSPSASTHRQFVDFAPEISFRKPIDSIAVSGHKMLGCPMPCGVALTRREHVEKVRK